MFRPDGNPQDKKRYIKTQKVAIYNLNKERRMARADRNM